jgi:pantothenate kinase
MTEAPGGVPVMATFAELLDRARQRPDESNRRIIGVVGTPGAGKTTLVEAVIRALATNSDGRPDGWIAHVPMDGFHLADVELSRLGRLDRKGAPDTFDANGYAALLRRIHETRGREETVYAPAFDRELEQPVAGSIPVLPRCELVLTEGNYLLLDEDDWRHVRAQLDEVWFLDADDEVRRSRLVRRHIQFGKAPTHAEAWVAGVDEPNAKLIAATRDSADVLVSGALLPSPPAETIIDSATDNSA